jgi:hypothetical protein
MIRAKDKKEKVKEKKYQQKREHKKEKETKTKELRRSAEELKRSGDLLRAIAESPVIIERDDIKRELERLTQENQILKQQLYRKDKELIKLSRELKNEIGSSAEKEETLNRLERRLKVLEEEAYEKDTCILQWESADQERDQHIIDLERKLFALTLRGPKDIVKKRTGFHNKSLHISFSEDVEEFYGTDDDEDEDDEDADDDDEDEDGEDDEDEDEDTCASSDEEMSGSALLLNGSTGSGSMLRGNKRFPSSTNSSSINEDSSEDEVQSTSGNRSGSISSISLPSGPFVIPSGDHSAPSSLSRATAAQYIIVEATQPWSESTINTSLDANAACPMNAENSTVEISLSLTDSVSSTSDAAISSAVLLSSYSRSADVLSVTSLDTPSPMVRSSSAPGTVIITSEAPPTHMGTADPSTGTTTTTTTKAAPTSLKPRTGGNAILSSSSATSSARIPSLPPPLKIPSAFTQSPNPLKVSTLLSKAASPTTPSSPKSVPAAAASTNNISKNVVGKDTLTRLQKTDPTVSSTPPPPILQLSASASPVLLKNKTQEPNNVSMYSKSPAPAAGVKKLTAMWEKQNSM